MKKLCAFIFVASFLFGNSAADDDGEEDGDYKMSKGGYLISLSDTPYLVTLKWINKDSFCGGAIIADDAILTAAHCVADKKATDIIVRVGSNYRNSGGVLMRVKSITIHPSFVSATREFDFAVLILVKKIVLKPLVAEIVLLPDHNETFNESEVGIVSGFEDPKMFKSVNDLRGVALQLAVGNSCKLYHPDTNENFFCAQNYINAPTSCFGYSGVALRGYLVERLFGIAIYSVDYCGTPPKPLLFAKVSIASDWIHQTARIAA